METVCLYRALSLDELSDISTTGGFRSVPGSLEGKWSAETRHDALAWGRIFYGSQPFRVVSVQVPLPIANAFFRIDRLDSIGAARFGDLAQLSRVVIDQVPDE